MPPKRATNKKAATKVAASSADAKVSNNSEKEVVEELATDAKNGSALNDAEESKESTISKAPTKRSSGRGKNVASELETETPASKKPAAKGRGKKKTNENEVIENDAPQAESQEAEETTTKENDEVEVEAVTKPKGRGGGGKKAEPKAKNTSKAKVAESVQDEESNEADEAKGTVKKSRTVAKAKVAESVQDEESNEAEEAKGTAKKSRTVAGKRKKQEAVTKAEEEVEVKQEIEEELMEKAPKKSSRNSKKTEEIPADIEPQKKKGRAAKKEKVVDKEEVKEEVEEVEVKVDVKEKKPTKRGRGVAKAAVVAEETAAANGDAEEVLPKKRSRKAPSVEKEIVPEKPKRGGRAKKADKEAEKLAEESSSSPVQGKEEDEISNGEVKRENLEEIEETPSSTKEVAEEAEEPAAPAKKTRGGRKRAAPSTNKKKTAKTAADDNNELDDGVDNADMDDEADGSKPSKSKKNKTGTAPLNATATKYDKADFELPPPADGQTVEEPRFNLKISSWNVAGLRSWLKKEGLKYLEYEEPDIFCMQETKCTTEQLPEEVVRIPGYHPYWLCMPGGYAGVAIYSKIMPINVEYGIGHKEFDDCGRIITAEYEKFFLINVYVPNSGRKLVNLEARMKWEKLFQEFIKNLDARKPVVICGDMNVSHQEHDLANPKTNTRNAGFTKEERDKMSELLALGYVDTFRHLYPERKGAYTFWTYMGNARSRNVGWRLDYFIVSERFIKRVVDNCIRSQCLGSDHCPITLFLKL